MDVITFSDGFSHVIRVHDPTPTGHGASLNTAQDSHGSHFIVINVTLSFHDYFVPSLSVSHHANLVTHGS